MCKVVLFTNMRHIDVKRAANVLGPELLSMERDGFGYAVQGKRGQFGEKYVGKHFESRLGRRKDIGLPIVKKQYSFFGVQSEPVGPGIFHGRTSTNVKGLSNCHPMQRDGWSLVHNGVVTNHGEKYPKATDNDSEDVLYHLIKGMESVEKSLSGYYAFGAIDAKGLLHVAKDATASLYVAYSKTKETYIFATTAALIELASSELKLKVGPIDEVEDNVYMTFALNDLASKRDIKPLGYSYVESKYASQSLGRSLYSTGLSYGGLEDRSRDFKFDSEAKETSTEVGIGKDGVESVEFSSLDEDSYYAWRHEVDSMDAAWTIETEDGTSLTVEEFRRLDFATQERCTVTRPDGTTLRIK